MNQFILVLCGLPASGKSTLADAIQIALDHEVEIVRTDDWRDDAYYTDWKPEKEKPVRQKALARVKELVTEGKSIIHDDTNYYTSMRHELFEIAVEKKCGFAIIHVSTPVLVALRWNQEREGTKIPDSVIHDVFERFDNPGSRYLWDTADLEVSLEIQEIERVIPEIVKVLQELEPASIPKPLPVACIEFERLDTETRLTVSEFLEAHPKLRGNRDVSLTRHSFLRKASEMKTPVDGIHELLWTELEKLL
ncbi:MAG: AAA family ATPase [Candidatus Thorarchaeota archaeon]